MLNLALLEELLAKNNVYPDTPEGRTAMAEEQAARNSMSAIPYNYQSISTSRMFSDFDERMEKDRVTFILHALFQGNPIQFNEEKQFFEAQIPMLTQRIAEIDEEIRSFVLPQKTLHNKVSATFSSSYTNMLKAREAVLPNLRKEKGILETVLTRVRKQLEVYISEMRKSQIATRKNRKGRRRSMSRKYRSRR